MTEPGRPAELSRLEVVKDTVQEVTESAATRVGRIATILAGAARDVAHELGELASDLLDVREAAGRARAAVREDGNDDG